MPVAVFMVGCGLGTESYSSDTLMNMVRPCFCHAACCRYRGMIIGHGQHCLPNDPASGQQLCQASPGIARLLLMAGMW